MAQRTCYCCGSAVWNGDGNPLLCEFCLPCVPRGRPCRPQAVAGMTSDVVVHAVHDRERTMRRMLRAAGADGGAEIAPLAA